MIKIWTSNVQVIIARNTNACKSTTFQQCWQDHKMISAFLQDCETTTIFNNFPRYFNFWSTPISDIRNDATYWSVSSLHHDHVQYANVLKVYVASFVIRGNENMIKICWLTLYAHIWSPVYQHKLYSIAYKMSIKSTIKWPYKGKRIRKILTILTTNNLDHHDMIIHSLSPHCKINSTHEL